MSVTPRDSLYISAFFLASFFFSCPPLLAIPSRSLASHPSSHLTIRRTLRTSIVNVSIHSRQQSLPATSTWHKTTCSGLPACTVDLATQLYLGQRSLDETLRNQCLDRSISRCATNWSSYTQRAAAYTISTQLTNALPMAGLDTT